tara:strand:+ start:772 stop:1707 length:936 start_codon:yes stop_codon:yes gene_type:complete
MNKFKFNNFEFRHSMWFAVLVIILYGLFAKNYEIINNNITNLICFFLIATIGVSHGSLDNYKGKKLLKFYKLKNSIIFYLSYIFVSTFIIFIWKVFPSFTLLIFLLIAAYHFGKEDGYKSLSKIKQQELKIIYYFSRGTIIIISPLVFHPNETIEIFRVISSDLFINSLLFLKKYYFFETMLGLILLSCFLITGNEFTTFIFEIPSILAINYFFTPFFAFTIYFCFLHSVRHIISLSHELNRANIKKGFIIFINKALPLSLITAILFILALFFLFDPSQLNEGILKVIFIGLASLTFPHILLEYLIEKNEK